MIPRSVKLPPVTIPTRHPWVSKKGIALLKRVQRKILRVPPAYNQETWAEPVEKTKAHPCGTAACVAGWVCLLGTGKSMDVLNRRYDFYQGWQQGAERLLGMKYPYSGDSLFTGYPRDFWPAPFGEKYDQATTARQRAEVAVARINHFLETGQ